ncbi:MAG: hypothetical protein ACFBSD_01820 [Paracoccaceae bacterium]
MSFSEAVDQLPDWVQLWVLWLNIVTIAACAVAALARVTWVEAGAILLANALMVPTMLWLYGQVGMVRLLGLPHIVFWTPLLVWLVLRLRRRPLPAPQRIVLSVYAGSIALSLAFDYTDVARWLAGERAPLVPVSPA